jgi:hypothetical protein
MEQVLFRGVKVFGDKTGVFGFKNTIAKLKMPYKLLYIYRDGRDVVASAVRHYLMQGKESGWVTNDIAKSSQLWADAHKEFESFRDEREWAAIRFEDYMESPYKICRTIADLTGIDLDIVMNRRNQVFNDKVSHIGYHKQIIPSWEEHFTEDAKALLKRLGYE